MSPHRVVTTGRADEGIERAVAYYLHAGSPRSADDFVDALEACVQRIAAHPSIGSPRFAIETGIAEIRTVAVQRFPYLVFSSEDADAVRVHRVLHTSRDLPAEYAR